MNLIRVADGLWSEGEKLYFYNPFGPRRLPVVAEFVPVGTTEISEGLCFDVSKAVSVAWFNCYLNRDAVVRMAKSVLVRELNHLEDEKAKIQAKIDELE